MVIDEALITRAIVKAAVDKLYRLAEVDVIIVGACLLYTSPSPRD